MQVDTFAIEGPLLIRPRRFGDDRGFFAETYNERRYAEYGIDAHFVQDNVAFSSTVDTIRGLHFQAPPAAQAKLVTAYRGAVVDVAVDIRVGSPTYGQSISVVLDAAQGDQFFVPRGFAHAYRTVAADTLIAYKVDGFYTPEAEGGLPWDDPDLAIDWTAQARVSAMGEPALSERDRRWPAFADFQSPFG